MRGLEASVPGRMLFQGLRFSLGEGEVLLVTGRSGTGKTSLLRILAGLAGLFGIKAQGSIRVLGEKPGTSNLARIVHYIPQEPWFSLTTPYVAYELLSYTRAGLREAVEALRELGVGDKIMESTSNLSAGEAQRILLAEALLSGKKLILIDEVTSYLDEESRMMAVKAVKRIVEQGSAAIVVDHNVEIWRSVVSRVLYLEGGRVEYHDDPLETPVYHAMRELRRRLRPPHTMRGGLVAAAENLYYRYPDGEGYVLEGLSLSVHEGELLWIRGGSGRGKTTLLKLLAGIYKPTKGRITRPRGVQLVPENPLLYISSPTVIEELGGRRELAELAGLGEVLETPLLRLSSGERRRLAIVSAYSRQPRLLLVDEPTVGLDPWNASKVLGLLVSLAERGSGVIVASHGAELGLVASKSMSIG